MSLCKFNRLFILRNLCVCVCVGVVECVTFARLLYQPNVFMLIFDARQICGIVLISEMYRVAFVDKNHSFYVDIYTLS